MSDNSKSKTHFHKFISFYRPYRRLLAADIACAFVATAAALLIPLCTRRIIQGVEAGGGNLLGTVIIPAAGLMLTLILVQSGCTLFLDAMGHIMGARMERDMRAELFDRLQLLPVSFYDRHETGDLLSRMTRDLDSLAELCHHGPEDFVIYLLRLIGAVVILLTINSKLALALCAMLPVLLVYALIFNRRLSACYKTSYKKIGEVNSMLEDSLLGIRTVKAFANEAVERARFARENHEYYRSKAAIYREEAWYYSILVELLAPMLTFVTVALGGWWITGGKMSAADLITFLLYIGYLTAPIPQLARIVNQYQSGKAAFNRFMEIACLPPEAEGPPSAGALAFNGEICFDDVTFRYASGNRDVLANLSLRIQAGEYIALVGESGVGKTTLCSLIPRLYEVSGGTVTLDGRDVRDYPLGDLRRSIGMVQQDVYLFGGTIMENIAYGKPGACDADIIEAAKQANAHDFIMALPNGYHTQIGQRGVTLSGGQRQRISIARVFLKDPAVLILDEATSALDNRSERQIYQALERLIKGRTTIVIAHRLSTIRSADRIIVLAETGIAEQGSHNKLLESGGIYAELYRQMA